MHDSFKEGLLYLIISLAHVELYGHKTLHPLHLSVHSMEDLITNQNVVFDQSSWYECIMVLRDD
jgi:hypothetical protein